MKLHLPKLLRNAVLACMVSLTGISASSSGADVISVNFGSSNDSSNGHAIRPGDTEEINGSTGNRWNNIIGANKEAVNGVHTLKSELADNAASLVLSTTANPWGPGGAGDTLTSQLHSGYLDISNTGGGSQWTLDINSDYMVADLYLYLSGDGDNEGNKYNPILINGESYIGGTNQKGDAAWGVRSNSQRGTISDNNRIIVTGVSGTGLHVENVVSTTNRSSLAGFQLVEGAVYKTSLAAGVTQADSLNWTQGSTSSTLSGIADGSRYLATAADSAGSTLNFATSTTLQGLQVTAGSMTLTAGSGVELNIDLLMASKDATMNVGTTLASGSDLTLGGRGTIIINESQVLENLVISGNVQLADGVIIQLSGDCTISDAALISCGSGAGVFGAANEAGVQKVTGGGVTLNVNKSWREDLVNDGVAVSADATAQVVFNGDGTITFSNSSTSDVTVTLSELTVGTTAGAQSIAAVEGTSVVGNFDGQLMLMNNQVFTVGKGVSLSYKQADDYPGGRAIVLGHGTLNIDGGSITAESLCLADGGGSRKSNLSITNGGYLEITSTDNDNGKGGGICLSHWQFSTSNVLIEDGEFRALGAKVNVVNDATRVNLTIGSAGVMNTKGLRMHGNANVSVSGMLNLGTTGIENHSGTFTLDGGTLGALDAAGWNSQQNMSLAGDSKVYLAVYDVNSKTYSGSANIGLKGNFETAEGSSLTLYGDGVLTLRAPMNDTAVHIAEGAGASVVLEANADMSKFSYVTGGTFTGYGDSTTDGYATQQGYRIFGAESTIAQIKKGEEVVNLQNGCMLSDTEANTVFGVNTSVNLTDAYAAMADKTVLVGYGATLEVTGNAEHAIGTLKNSGEVTISADTTIGTLENSSEVTISADTTIGTLNMSGTISAGEVTIAADTTIEHLIIGYDNMLTVSSGAELTLTGRDDRSIKGNILVTGTGSKFIVATEGRDDHIMYAGNSQSITVENGGELSIGANRWTVSGGTTFNLNNGAITGTGQNNNPHPVILDYIGGATINSAGTSRIEGGLRINGGHNLTLNVTNGTLTIEDKAYTSDKNGSVITKTGSGLLVLNQGFNLTGGLNITGGAVQVGAALTLGGAMNGQNYLNNLSSLSIAEGGSLTTTDGTTLKLGSTIVGAAGTTVSLGASNVIVTDSLDNLRKSSASGMNGTGDAAYMLISGSTVTLNGAIVKVGDVEKTASTVDGGLYVVGTDTTTYWVVEADNPVTWSSSDSAMTDAGCFYVGLEGTLNIGADSSFAKPVTNEGTVNLISSAAYLNKVTNMAGAVVNVTTESGAAVVALSGAFAAESTLDLTVSTVDGKTVATADGGNYRGDVTIKEGYTLKAAQISAFGPDRNSAPNLDRYIIVEGGATLDTAGQPIYYQVKLQEDAMLTSSANDTGSNNHAQLPKLVLEGDATIKAVGGIENDADGYEIRMIGRGYNETTLELKGHTLTKEGTGWLYLKSTTADYGTIDITAGTVVLEAGNTRPVFTGVDIKVAADSALKIVAGSDKVAEVKSITGAGSLVYDNEAFLTVVGDAAASEVAVGSIVVGTEARHAARLNLGANVTLKNTVEVQNGTLYLGGTGTYDNGSSLSLNKVVLTDSGIWNGTVKVSGAQVTAATDLSGMCVNDSSLLLNGLTVADGASLTLGGKVTLDGAVSVAESIANAGALTFGSGLQLDLTGMTVVTGENGASVITLLTGAGSSNLGSLTDAVLTEATKALGTNWVFNADGTISFKSSSVLDDLYWEGGDADWSSNGWTTTDGATADQGFVAGSNVIFSGTDSTITVDSAVTVGTMTVSGADYTFNGSSAITADSLVIETGASATFGAGTLALDSLNTLTVDGTLDVGGMYAAGGDASTLVQKAAEATGTGKIVLGDSWWARFGGEVSYNVDLEATDCLEFNSFGGDLSISINGNLVVTADADTEDGKSGDLLLDNAVTMTVTNGASVIVDGMVRLGHTEGGTKASHVVLNEGASLKASSISKTDATGSTFTMEGGTLELTGTGGIASGIAVEITGGTLKAGANDWGITGTMTDGTSNASIGGATIETGEGTITVKNATLTSGLNNDNGNLAFEGTINLDTTDYTPESYETTGYSNGDNGYVRSDVNYEVASNAANTSLTGEVTWKVDNSSTGVSYADGVVTVKGAEGTKYYINSGTGKYTDIIRTNAAGDAMTAIVLAGTGGFNLNNNLADGETIEVAYTGTSVIDIAAEKTLAASQLKGADADSEVKLHGAGTYNLGNSLELSTGIVLGTDWNGTVQSTATGITEDTALELGSKVELTAETFTLGGILTAGEGTALTMNALSITNVGDAGTAARLTAGSLTLDSITVTRDALAGLTTGTWTLVDVDTLTGVTTMADIAGAGEGNLYKYSFSIANGVITMTGEVNGLVWGNDTGLGADSNQSWESTATQSDTNVVFNGECNGDPATAGTVKVDSIGVAAKDVTITTGDNVTDPQKEYTFTGGDIAATGSLTIDKETSLTIDNTSSFDGGVKVQDGELTVVEDAKLTVGTDTTAADMTVDAAKGSLTVHAGSLVEVTGTLSTDTINVASLADGQNAMIQAGTLSSATTGGDITIDLDDDILASVGTGTYDLIEYGTSASDIVLDAADEQAILKKGYWVDAGVPPTTFALGTTDTTFSMVVSDDDITWNVGDTEADNGLIVMDGSSLKSSDILDNVDIVKVSGSKEIDLTAAGINGVKLNNLTAEGTAAVLSITGDGAVDDTVTISTPAAGYAGIVKLDSVQADLGSAAAPVKGATVVVEGDTVVLNGALQDGTLVVDQGASLTGNNLELKNSLLGVDIGTAGTVLDAASVEKIMTDGLVKVEGLTTDAADKVAVGTYTDAAGFQTSTAYDKYFAGMKVENGGVVRVDRNTSYYSNAAGNAAATTEELSENGKAGIALADAALVELNPQATAPKGGLAKVLTALDTAVASKNAAEMDELGAALAGASTAVLGMAAHGDLDRQLQAVRNRTTTMGVDQSVVNHDMPYFNAWINAEGDHSELSDDGTEGGYKLNSWGGTVGFDVDIAPTFTAGMALTAMYGDLSVTGADEASGDLNTYYVSAFARYCASAWTHTFVATAGLSDITLNRTVMGEEIEGETDGVSFGLMYEVGRVFALDEDGTACLQPIFNVAFCHTTVNGYDEKGSDLALKVDSQTLNTVTFGLGARMQAIVGESMYNRTSIFECRLLAKFDAGDRSSTSETGLLALKGTKAETESAERGGFGLEAGAGLTIPMGDEGGSLFMDASVELRADYVNVNGTVGYRVNF